MNSATYCLSVCLYSNLPLPLLLSVRYGYRRPKGPGCHGCLDNSTYTCGNNISLLREGKKEDFIAFINFIASSLISTTTNRRRAMRDDAGNDPFLFIIDLPRGEIARVIDAKMMTCTGVHGSLQAVLFWIFYSFGSFATKSLSTTIVPGSRERVQ